MSNSRKEKECYYRERKGMYEWICDICQSPFYTDGHTWHTGDRVEEMSCKRCYDEWREEEQIEKKEQIAFIIFDHEYCEDEERPSEETCHSMAEEILNYLKNKENNYGKGV